MNLDKMEILEFKKFEEVSAKDFLPILNNLKLREHLMTHDLFDLDSAQNWILSKINIDALEGCRIRVIVSQEQVVGWCGIQFENELHEIAIVIDDKFWGQGIQVFQEVMSWANALGHSQIYIHFLHTRPRYKFLQKLANRVYETELYNNRFTTYELDVTNV